MTFGDLLPTNLSNNSVYIDKPREFRVEVIEARLRYD